VLRDDGCYINTLGTARNVVDVATGALLARIGSRQRAIGLVLRNDAARWTRLAGLASAGALRPHVERVITLDDVADAQRAMETGHGRGKVAVLL
jgi:NADPH:quinone reductase-like Zn-dependent oxidoreductase